MRSENPGRRSTSVSSNTPSRTSSAPSSISPWRKPIGIAMRTALPSNARGSMRKPLKRLPLGCWETMMCRESHHVSVFRREPTSKRGSRPTARIRRSIRLRQPAARVPLPWSCWACPEPLSSTKERNWGFPRILTCFLRNCRIRFGSVESMRSKGAMAAVCRCRGPEKRTRPSVSTIPAALGCRSPIGSPTMPSPVRKVKMILR